MQFNSHIRIKVPERAFINLAKNEISRLAEKLSFTVEQKGKIDIIVSEMASNLIKHNTQDGELLAKIYSDNFCSYIEIISADKGPGMQDTSRMMQDGVSTYGSKGEGLGAIKRLSDEFDIYSLPGVGTSILSRIFQKPKNKLAEKAKISIQAVNVPKSPEKVSGDSWAFVAKGNMYQIIALDGLGHGEHANNASSLAIEVFLNNHPLELQSSLKNIHNEIKKTRGAVGCIAKLDIKDNKLSFCGIGNISAKIVSPLHSKNLVSYNGTLGHNVPSQFHENILPWEEFDLVILHSDGIKSRWDISRYPGIFHHDPSLIAAVIYKDNVRGTDDAMVIVVHGKFSGFEK